MVNEGPASVQWQRAALTFGSRFGSVPFSSAILGTGPDHVSQGGAVPSGSGHGPVILKHPLPKLAFNNYFFKSS